MYSAFQIRRPDFARKFAIAWSQLADQHLSTALSHFLILLISSPARLICYFCGST